MGRVLWSIPEHGSTVCFLVRLSPQNPGQVLLKYLYTVDSFFEDVHYVLVMLPPPLTPLLCSYGRVIVQYNTYALGSIEDVNPSSAESLFPAGKWGSLVSLEPLNKEPSSVQMLPKLSRKPCVEVLYWKVGISFFRKSETLRASRDQNEISWEWRKFKSKNRIPNLIIHRK